MDLNHTIKDLVTLSCGAPLASNGQMQRALEMLFGFCNGTLICGHLAHHFFLLKFHLDEKKCGRKMTLRVYLPPSTL